MRTEEKKTGNGATATADGQVVINAQDLKKHFPVTKGLLLARKVGSLKAVDGISFQIKRGDTMGLVGESGCGKSTTAKMLLLLEKPTEGNVFFKGQSVTDKKVSPELLREYRRNVQAVFQDPWSSLNPRMRVREIISEPVDINMKLGRNERKERVEKLLVDVGLHPYQQSLYPHEFSGGQRQRIAIARALALNPDVIILDEPVSALDVSIRAQIMNLLKDLQEQYNLSFLLIAHNLATVRYMCHWVSVMYLGKIVEYAQSNELFENPLHPYTKALISAALPSHPDIQREEIILPGEVPSPLNPPSGCHFHPRCPYVMSHCSEIDPPLQEVQPNHWVACHLYYDVRPKAAA